MKNPRHSAHFGSILSAALLAAVALIVANHPAWAQSNLFGGPRPVAIGGIAGWVLGKQAMFYQELAGMIRAARNNGSALWGLMGILIRLRHFSCRRSGPRQGGNLLLSRRQ